VDFGDNAPPDFVDLHVAGSLMLAAIFVRTEPSSQKARAVVKLSQTLTLMADTLHL
jgi:hypothetical protein